MGCRAAAAALIEEDDAIAFRIEEPAMGGFTAGTRPPVQEDGGGSAPVATLLHVERMDAVGNQPVGGVGPDGRVEITFRLHSGKNTGQVLGPQLKIRFFLQVERKRMT